MRGNSGQALVEVIIAATVIIVVAVAISQTISTTLQSISSAKAQLTAVFLSRGDVEATRAVVREDWYNISTLTTSTGMYVPTVSGSKWVLSNGSTTVTLNGIVYSHWVTFSEVYRSTSTSDVTSTAGYYDPSTIKVTTNVTWTDLLGRAGTFSQVEYLSRYINDTYPQTDWSGGSVGESVESVVTTTFATSTGLNTTSTAGSLQLIIQ